MDAKNNIKTKTKIQRFDPTKDIKPYYEEYEYILSPGMTVLDVLNYIHSELDPTLSYSYSCRNRHCGLCGIMANKKPALSCKYKALPDMTIEPLSTFPVLKDLTVERAYYEKHRDGLRLMLERYKDAESVPEKINAEDFEKFKKASRCIECYCCLSSCPVYKNMPHRFIGPAGLVLESRHIYDPRDDLNRDLILKDSGISECIECGLCTDHCMMDVRPGDIISELKHSQAKK